MLCQNCGENEANVSYTQIINGRKTQMNLCSKCAHNLGIDKIEFKMPKSLSTFLYDMFDDFDEMYFPELANYKEYVCNNCNLTFDKYLDNRKIGCDKCYDNFEDQINRLLRNSKEENLHSKQDEEKNIKKGNEKENNKEISKLEELENRLKKEIEEERYEDAAITRDEIKKIKK